MGSNRTSGMQRRLAVAEVAIVDNTPESDGLKSARELRDFYLQKASWVERFNPTAGSYYRSAADDINKLLGDVAARQLNVTFALAVPE